MTIQEMIDKLEHFKKTYGPDVVCKKRFVHVGDGSIRYSDIKEVRANHIDLNDPLTLVINI